MQLDRGGRKKLHSCYAEKTETGCSGDAASRDGVGHREDRPIPHGQPTARGIGVAFDARSLGSGDIVERVTAHGEGREKKNLRLRRKVPELEGPVKEVAKRQGASKEKLKMERRTMPCQNDSKR